MLNLHHLIHFPSQMLDKQIDKRFVMALSWLAIANAIKIFRHWLSITCMGIKTYLHNADIVFKRFKNLKVTESKPSLVNQQCVVYEYQCNSCDSNYIGYTSRHLHLRIEEHKYSVIGKHLKDKHNQRPTNLQEHFTILKKCHGKFECLIYEMLLIRKKRPTLNTQNESIPAKLFI